VGVTEEFEKARGASSRWSWGGRCTSRPCLLMLLRSQRTAVTDDTRPPPGRPGCI